MKKTIFNLALTLVTVSGMAFFTTGCSSDKSGNGTEENTSASAEASNKASEMGIGPITSPLTLGSIDDGMAESGSKIFAAKCVACHALDKKVVGPALSEVTKRRSPEWIMNMILNPSEMTAKDPVAMELLGQYIAPMANQNLTQEEARQVLEYFRKNDNN